MRIAILGTRGIPNNYGGFEQFAEYLSIDLVERGWEVTVYNSHNHPYQKSEWNSVLIEHKFDPEYRIGTAGQFVYDLNCVLDARKKKFDVVLQLGYTSSSVWNFLLPKHSVLVTNMDGLEWKRTKYGKITRRFLEFAEKLAVKKSNYLIADSLGIKSYISRRYNVASTFIPYGANIFNDPNEEVIKKYNLNAYQYDMLIARLEPENSIEIILDGVAKSKVKRPFIVIGNNKTKYGQYLVAKFKYLSNIVFFGSLYEIKEINNLRHFSNLYFHGHTVGGTNPSLLEAMASSALIAASKNEFNESILEDSAYYFNSVDDVAQILDQVVKDDTESRKIRENQQKIINVYSWSRIVDEYERFLKGIL